MKLTTGRIQLSTALKTCLEHWEATKRCWHDPVCKDFDEKIMLPLDMHVQSTLRAIDRLAGVMEEMLRQCGTEDSLEV